MSNPNAVTMLAHQMLEVLNGVPLCWAREALKIASREIETVSSTVHAPELQALHDRYEHDTAEGTRRP